MLESWLSFAPRSDCPYSFQVADVEPSRNLEEEDVEELKRLAIQARFSLEFLTLAAEKLG